MLILTLEYERLNCIHQVQRLLEASYERSRSLLLKYHREHKALAEALLKFETLDGEEIDKVVKSCQKVISRGS